jgi:flagellar hook-basal body complex protein FliE
VIVPAIGSFAAELAAGAQNATQGLAGAASGSGAAAPATLESTGVDGTAASTGGSGFGGALTDAISSLEKTQQSGSEASQALAMGTVKDPEAAVVTVEDAQLAMQLASQLRTKATEAVQTIFQTQV